MIALFFELTGRGHFPQFLWYGLSASDTYDARAVIKRASDPETVLTEPKASDLRVVEFKLRGASIARDFDREDKRQDRMHLIICYEVGDSPLEAYQVIPFEDSKYEKADVEPFPGVTHVLLDTVTGRETQILPLKEFLKMAYPPQAPAEIPSDVNDAD